MKTLIIVIDSLGCGEAPDSHLYGDQGSNTLLHTVKQTKVNLENLKQLGLFNIDGLQELNLAVENPLANYARMQELSKGKDTTTGHFEMMGCVLEKPFPTFPNGFPKQVTDKLEKAWGTQILGNCVASGTEIIERLGKLHLETKKPIVYTSADSVLQIACHEEVYSVEKLYKMCEQAREIMQGEYGVSRIIARPFITENGNFVRTLNRHDFALKPPCRTVLEDLQENGFDTIGIGKIGDIFAMTGISENLTAKNNQQGLQQILYALKQNYNGVIFANLVDTDMLFGHRNDVNGYANALKEIDNYIPQIINLLNQDDTLIITGDHGCDPTTESTDHSREYTPLLIYSKSKNGGNNLGTIKGFNYIAQLLKQQFINKN